jgi:hypothetical protein
MATLKRLSKDDIKQLLKLIENDMKEPTHKRGRPKVYSDKFIMLVFFIKTIRGYSFRDTVFYLEKELNMKMPSISTLHYRFSKLDKKYLEKLFNKILEKLEIDEEFEMVAVDGTGFGYDDKRDLSWMRGKKIRQVSSHVKVELIVGRKGEEKETMLIGVNMVPAYSDERKLLLEMIDGMNVKVKYIMADALYGMSVDVLKEFFDRADIVLVPVRDTLHTKVKDPIRKRAKEIYESNREKYRDRYIVEQVIGKIKNAYGSSEWRLRWYG